MATAEASSELDSVVEQVLNAAAQAVVSASTREVVRGMVQRLQSTNERLQQLENDNLTLRDALKNVRVTLDGERCSICFRRSHRTTPRRLVTAW